MRKKTKILHGIGMLALMPVLLTLLCGCRKSDSALLIAAQESEAETSGIETGASGSDATGTDAAGTDAADGSGATETDDAVGSRGDSDGTDGSGDSTEEDGLYIYICGEVINPGVYILDATARLCDAVEAAGGMTESASRTYWNLAMQLSDGQMIYSPSMEEAAERDFSPLTAADAGSIDGAGSSGSSGSGSLGSTGGTGSAGSSTAGISADGKVNINTATKEQLMTVPGIGSAKADSIIAYRETNGSYAAIDDIMNVSGIKEGLFQSMKEYITVD
jgi:competence protein ComEA